MDFNLRKILPVAAMICSMASGLSAAQHDMQSSQSDMDKPRQITPGASPRVENGADVFISADFIYWSVREDGLNFATSGYANSPTTTLTKGQVVNPDFSWHPGFKVGIGLTMAHDDWDLFLEYTWLNSPSSTDSLTSNTTTNSTMQSTWIYQVNDVLNRITLARGDWSDNMNVGDLTLGRNLFISHYLSLRPHVGLKAGWHDQKYNVAYQEVLGTGNITETRLRFRNQSFGIGLLFGMDSAYFFDKNWSLFGDFAATALASHFDVDQKATDFELNNTVKVGADRVVYNYNNKIDTITPVIEWAMGVRWDYWFNEDSYHVGLQLGWEQQWWYGMNRFHNMFQGDDRGNLVMQGVTFKLRFDF